jgi:hypothetical protein
MGHFVTSDDSDYFVGYCPCSQLPCVSCVEAQQRIESKEKVRCKLLSIYYAHHQAWPTSTFIDAILEACKPSLLDNP